MYVILYEHSVGALPLITFVTVLVSAIHICNIHAYVCNFVRTLCIGKCSTYMYARAYIHIYVYVCMYLIGALLLNPLDTLLVSAVHTRNIIHMYVCACVYVF